MYYAVKWSFGRPMLQTWWNSVAAVDFALLAAYGAAVQVETPSGIRFPHPFMPRTSLQGRNKPPTIAMTAHGTEVGEQVPIFGRVFLPVQAVGVHLEIPAAKSLAPWAFHSGAVCGFLADPIHKRIRMRVVHVGGLFVCHVSSVARMEDPVKDYFSLFGRLQQSAEARDCPRS